MANTHYLNPSLYFFDALSCARVRGVCVAHPTFPFVFHRTRTSALPCPARADRTARGGDRGARHRPAPDAGGGASGGTGAAGAPAACVCVQCGNSQTMRDAQQYFPIIICFDFSTAQIQNQNAAATASNHVCRVFRKNISGNQRRSLTLFLCFRCLIIGTAIRHVGAHHGTHTHTHTLSRTLTHRRCRMRTTPSRCPRVCSSPRRARTLVRVRCTPIPAS